MIFAAVPYNEGGYWRHNEDIIEKKLDFIGVNE